MKFELRFTFSLELLIPGESKTMRREAGDHIVQPIAIYVVRIHLRTAWAAELEGVFGPLRISGERLGLFPPAVFLEQIGAAIAIHISPAKTMCEIASGRLVGDFVERPFFLWGRPIGSRIAEKAVGLKD